MRYRYTPEELKEGIGPEDSPLDWLSCQRLELGAGNPAMPVETGPAEVALVCIEGQVGFDFAGTQGTMEVQDFLYLPWSSRVTLQAPDKAVLMRIGAPSDRDTAFAHLRFAEVEQDPAKHKVFGSLESHTYRDVYMYIDEAFHASRLLMGIGKGGTACWTVWPPHEHGDEKEELYVYFDLQGGFGVQCLYESLDNPTACEIVREGDMMAVPRGYHPNVGCPGGRIAYLYAMAAREAGQRDFMALRFQEEYGVSF